MDLRLGIDGTFLAGVALGQPFVPPDDAVRVGGHWELPAAFAGESVTTELKTCVDTLEKVSLRARFGDRDHNARAAAFTARATAVLIEEGYEATATAGDPTLAGAFSVVFAGPSTRTIIGYCGVTACDVWVVGRATDVVCLRHPRPTFWPP